jgi:LPS-assembly lipoprotein
MSLRRIVRVAAVAALTLSLAACFRPLYGTSASGANVPALLASVEVAAIDVPVELERVSHYLRSELIFDLDGSGTPAPKRYKLVVNYSQSIATPIVDTASGRALSATITGNAAYTLTTADGTPVTKGNAVSSASYDRFPQRFASVRAGRDAEIRVAKLLADQIRTQLAAFLATRA